MTLLTTLKEAPTKELLRAYNSDKDYLYFDISVFNVGASINIICTNTFKQINYGSWNGYDCIHENDYLIKEFIFETLKDRIKNDVLKIKNTTQLKRIESIIKNN